MVDERLVAQAGRLLLEAAPPGSGVYLFGSQARGDARPDSDLDFLIIEPEVTDQRAEMVRLRDTLRPLRVASEVIVTTWRVFEEWRNTPNNILYEVAREGRALHEMG